MIKIIVIVILFVITIFFVKNILNKDTNENFTPTLRDDKSTQKKNNIQLNKTNNIFHDSYAFNFNENPFSLKPLDMQIPRQIYYTTYNREYGISYRLVLGFSNSLTNLLFGKIINDIIFVKQYSIDTQNDNEILYLLQTNKLDIGIVLEDTYFIANRNINTIFQYHNLHKLKEKSNNQLVNTHLQKDIQDLNDKIQKIYFSTNETTEFYNSNRFVCSLYNSYFTFVVKNNSGIRNFREIGEGVVFGVLGDSQDTFRITHLISLLNIDNGKIKIFNNQNDLYLDFINSKIDILFKTCSHPDTFLVNLSNKIDINIINIDSSFNDRLIYFFPTCFISKFKVKEYKILTPSGFINSFALRSVVLANYKTNTWSIYSFLRLFINNLEYINKKTNYKYNQDLLPSQMSQLNKAFAYHSGSSLYWQNKGKVVIKNITDRDLNTSWYFWKNKNLNINENMDLLRKTHYSDSECLHNIYPPRPNSQNPLTVTGNL